MANHSYKNFATINERVAWQDAVVEATKTMPEILKLAKLNTSSSATNAYQAYFGAINSKRMQTVVGVLSAMDLALSASGITFVRVYTGNGAKNCAATNPPYGAWTDQSPGQIAKSAHASQHSYRMTVGNDFFTAENSIDGTLKSAQFNTFYHELSHLVGNTDDPVYGDAESKDLALNDPDSAIRCAENYGFYCERLYSAINGKGAF